MGWKTLPVRESAPCVGAKGGGRGALLVLRVCWHCALQGSMGAVQEAPVTALALKALFSVILKRLLCVIPTSYY